MTLALICLFGFTVLSLTLWVSFLWPARSVIACIAIIGLSVCNGLVFGLHPAPWSAVVLVLGIYQLVNLLRLVEGRTEPQLLKKISLKTALWLVGAQIVVLLTAGVGLESHISSELGWYAVAVLTVVSALGLLISTNRSLRQTKLRLIDSSIADRDLPSLSVLIPARNETTDLEDCLVSLLTCTYPKLEIIVLDDCSQNKRTPEIIKAFAQRGVRFIAGEVPPEHWLAKNYAYQQLSEAASGELLLFCGVDTRFSPDTLTKLVNLLIHKKKQMLSLMPANRLPEKWGLEQLLVQPGRYSWGIVFAKAAL